MCATSSPQKLGLIAGGGQLPQLICDEAQKREDFLAIAALQNTDAAKISNTPSQVFSIAKVGAILNFFKSHNVQNLILCGSLKRPNYLSLLPDAKGLAVIAKLMTRKMGDDALLKTIRAELEREGFKIMAVQDYMPQLLCPHGLLTQTNFLVDEFESIKLGWDAAKFLGMEDKGQSVVIGDGSVLGLEDENGTDALLKKVATENPITRKILIKRAKPQQDMALDAPTIGAHTIENLVKLGYAGLVCEAQKCLMIEREEIIKRANEYNLFIKAMSDEDFYHNR